MEYFFDWFMDKGISVRFNSFYAVVLGTIGTTMLTLAVLPSVLASHVEQIALSIIETGGHTILTIGLLGAIERATAHLSGEVGAGDAEDLLGHNMIDALLQVGNLLFKACQQPFGNLTQEDTAFATWVKKARLAGTEQLLWQQVEHSVGQLGRGEDLIAAQIGQAIEDVGAIRVLHIDKVGCNAMVDRYAQARRNFALRLVRRKDCTGGFL